MVVERILRVPRIAAWSHPGSRVSPMLHACLFPRSRRAPQTWRRRERTWDAESGVDFQCVDFHGFMVSGFGFAQYHWAGRGQENNFLAKFEPLFLYRISDRVLFEAGVEVELPDDTETAVNLEFAHFDYPLNKYVHVWLRLLGDTVDGAETGIRL